MTEAYQMGKGRLVLAIAALFLSSMCTMGDLVISPIVANLYEVYANEPMWLINLGITGPAIVGLPFGLVAGWLASQCGFVYSQRHGFKKLAVRGNFRAPRKKNDVTHNNVLFGYCCGRTIADYHDGFIIINPVEK